MVITKRGQTSTIGVTIALVLGVILIVFLIWGFTTNWTMFRSVTEIHTGKVNIDSAKQACSLQCQNNQQIQFCDIKKPVTYLKDGKVTSGSYSCGELAVVVNDDGFRCDDLCVFAYVGKCEGDEHMNCGEAKDPEACALKKGCAWPVTLEKTE